LKEAAVMEFSRLLKVFESVNNNNITKINFNNRDDIEISKQIRKTMNAILSKVGIQHEDDNLEVEYEMDCTADEEFARQLYLQEQATVNDLPVNINDVPNRRQRRAAAAATPRVRVPRVVIDPHADGVPPTPRPRGRPRRNPAPIV
jgi:hypothetical protein